MVLHISGLLLTLSTQACEG